MARRVEALQQRDGVVAMAVATGQHDRSEGRRTGSAGAGASGCVRSSSARSAGPCRARVASRPRSHDWSRLGDRAPCRQQQAIPTAGPRWTSPGSRGEGVRSAYAGATSPRRSSSSRTSAALAAGVVSSVWSVSSGLERRLVGIVDAREARSPHRCAPWRTSPSRRAPRRPRAACPRRPPRTRSGPTIVAAPRRASGGTG